MYKPTIGLEIHVELNTHSKMFCGCVNNSNERHPNINICPVCLGHPGTLPVINKEAIIKVLKLGLALNSKISEVSRFDRKSYFYPDLPKGYQISQYKQPLVEGGHLAGVKITRIHLEEDTARLAHAARPNKERIETNKKRIFDKNSISFDSDSGASYVDFNRAGVPLMELVTEPDIRNAKEAVAFAKELQLILRYLEISDADMEKGQLRVEANISLLPLKSKILNPKSKIQNSKLGTKVEIKNLNSFRAVEEAINYEIKRQTEILEKGEEVKQETRGWDNIHKKTISQRSKEEAHDYRYFPEPDLPILILRTSDVPNINKNNFRTSDVQKINIEKLKAEIPELPAEKRTRFEKEYGLTPAQIEILIEDSRIAQYFEEAAKELKLQTSNYKLQVLFNYLTSDLFGLMTEKGITIQDLKINPKHFAKLISLITENKISSRIAKDILKEMFLTGADPSHIIEEKGLIQITNEEEIKKIIKEVISKNQKAVEDYKKGKETALQFLIGKVIAQTKGKANPQIVKDILKVTLDKIN